MCTNCVFGTEVETEEQKNRRKKGEKNKRRKGRKDGRRKGQKNRRVEKGGVSGKKGFRSRKDFGWEGRTVR